MFWERDGTFCYYFTGNGVCFVGVGYTMQRGSLTTNQFPLLFYCLMLVNEKANEHR